MKLFWMIILTPFLIALTYMIWVIIIGFIGGVIIWDLSLISDNIFPWNTEHANIPIRVIALILAIFGPLQFKIKKLYQ